MTKDGWKDLVRQAVHEADSGQEETLDLLVQVLCDMDSAKQKMYDLGFGCTGMGILRTVEHVEEWVFEVRGKIDRIVLLVEANERIKVKP